MNPFLRYLADKHSAHTQTDRHTPMTTRPCGLRRAGKNTALQQKNFVTNNQFSYAQKLTNFCATKNFSLECVYLS